MLNATGSGPASVPTYASNFSYRAFGGVKDFDFGNSVHQHLNFNNRLQNTSLALSNVNTVGTMSWSYDYYADGKLSRVTDSNDPRFDRSFSYDQVGRIGDAKTGSEARGGTTADGPFKQTYNYDVWENATSRTYRVWTQGTQTDNPTYTNNRRQYWDYDNQGHLTSSEAQFGYDAAGNQNTFTSFDTVGGWPSNYALQPAFEVTQTFDGNSAPARKTTASRWEEFFEEGGSQVHETTTTTYYLRVCTPAKSGKAAPAGTSFRAILCPASERCHRLLCHNQRQDIPVQFVSTKLTLDIYSHIAPGTQSEAATCLEQLLYG